MCIIEEFVSDEIGISIIDEDYYQEKPGFSFLVTPNFNNEVFTEQDYWDRLREIELSAFSPDTGGSYVAKQQMLPLGMATIDFSNKNLEMVQVEFPNFTMQMWYQDLLIID